MPLVALFWSLVTAAPPAEPLPPAAVIAGPTAYCVGDYPVRIGANASLQPVVPVEPTYPHTVTIRLSQGSIRIAADVWGTEQLFRENRVRRLERRKSGSLFAYRPGQDSVFKAIFFPRERRRARLTISLLKSAAPGSRAVSQFNASTTPLRPADYRLATTLVDFDNLCPVA